MAKFLHACEEVKQRLGDGPAASAAINALGTSILSVGGGGGAAGGGDGGKPKKRRKSNPLLESATNAMLKTKMKDVVTEVIHDFKTGLWGVLTPDEAFGLVRRTPTFRSVSATIAASHEAFQEWWFYNEQKMEHLEAKYKGQKGGFLMFKDIMKSRLFGLAKDARQEWVGAWRAKHYKMQYRMMSERDLSEAEMNQLRNNALLQPDHTEGSRFRAVQEPFDEPAFQGALARAYYGMGGVNAVGECAVSPLTLSLQQVAYVAAKVRSLLHSSKEGGEECQAEYERLQEELEQWRQRNPGQQPRSVQLVDAASLGEDSPGQSEDSDEESGSSSSS